VSEAELMGVSDHGRAPPVLGHRALSYPGGSVERRFDDERM
jgi:hypothetical protein